MLRAFLPVVLRKTGQNASLMLVLILPQISYLEGAGARKSVPGKSRRRTSDELLLTCVSVSPSIWRPQVRPSNTIRLSVLEIVKWKKIAGFFLCLPLFAHLTVTFFWLFSIVMRARNLKNWMQRFCHKLMTPVVGAVRRKKKPFCSIQILHQASDRIGRMVWIGPLGLFPALTFSGAVALEATELKLLLCASVPCLWQGSCITEILQGILWFFF